MGQGRPQDAAGHALSRAGRRPWLLAAAALVLLYAWVAAALRPFTLPEDAAVALVWLPVAILVWRRSRRSGAVPPKPAPRSRRGGAVWIVLLGALLAWELVSYLSSPRDDHPTLSSITDSVMSTHPGRAAVFLLWLALGAALAVGGTRAARP